MALVEYSDSGEDEDIIKANAEADAKEATIKPVTLKRKFSEPSKPSSAAPTSELPPLPTSFHDLYATNVRTGTGDDPTLHGGRRRQIPHVEGNWPTHVYLEWHPKYDEAQRLQTIIARITQASPNVHTLLQSDLSAPLPLHISLSRSLVLHTDKRDEFLSRVRSNLKAVAVKPFTVNFSEIAWYPNYERTRWFLSLSAEKPQSNELNRLLGACNDACVAMEQPELYVAQKAGPIDRRKERKRRRSETTKRRSEAEIEIPDCSSSFHISLAWSLETQKLADGKDEVAPGELKVLATSFDCVKVKIGNTVTSLPLAPIKIDGIGKGLLG